MGRLKININRAVIEGGEAKAKSPERCKVLFFFFAFLLLGKAPLFLLVFGEAWAGMVGPMNTFHANTIVSHIPLAAVAPFGWRFLTHPSQATWITFR